MSTAAKPLVLAVCMPGSIHAARWVAMLRGGPFHFAVFPSVMQDLRPEFAPYRTIAAREDATALAEDEIGIVDDALVEAADRGSDGEFEEIRKLMLAGPTPAPRSLMAAIGALRPEIVHSLELQHAAYLCLAARRRIGARFPRWVASDWGSDVFLYRKLAAHQAVLGEMFAKLDAFHSECARNVQLASEMGFRGMMFPTAPGSGGVDFSEYPDPARLPPPSQRSSILVKGAHGWSGRSLNTLLAMHRIAPFLKGFQIRVTHAESPVARMVEALAREDGLDIAMDPYYPAHADAVARLARARVVIGCGISDGISTSLLEAMTVGTFSIQADTACGSEWITPGLTGLVVSPHDVLGMAEAIQRAVSDDALVDEAAIVNRAVVRRRWDARIVGAQVIDAYQQLLQSPAGERE